MAPTGQGGQWQDVLCCSLCNQHFELAFPPISLICGHVICGKCAKMPTAQEKPCPNDDWKPTMPVELYPINVALLSIVIPEENCMVYSSSKNKTEKSIDEAMIEIGKFFKRAGSERGGSVYSQRLSRTLQRKVVSLLCYQWAEWDGRVKCVKACRAITERVMTEVLLSIQSNTHISSQLWSAVRARGCQFLGPAMQQDVLRLILMTLENGEMIARKNLVMYVVSTLEQDYPQVSKTCVGHVVQLLYRASCFNVIKREGESSLMQLKDEFRTYDCLRREHDSQIVQIAFESGLRIGPDQWSALLYADQAHRSHMQSIIDKLQSPNSYSQCIAELTHALTSTTVVLVPKLRQLINDMMPYLTAFTDVSTESPSLQQLEGHLNHLLAVLKIHTEQLDREYHNLSNNHDEPRRYKVTNSADFRFKTKMCTNIEKNGHCDRGRQCSFAHSTDELRDNPSRRQPQTSLQTQQQQQQQQNHQQVVPQSFSPPAIPNFTQHQFNLIRQVPPPTQPIHHPPAQMLTYRKPSHPQIAHFYHPSHPHNMSSPPPPIPSQSQQHPQQQQHANCPTPPIQQVIVGFPPEPNSVPPPVTTSNAPPNGLMLMSSPTGQVMMAAAPPPPPPNALWATAAQSPTGTTNLIFPSGPSPPGTVWIQSTQPSMFPVESYEYGGLIWGNAIRDSGADAEQLIAKRNEIINRLQPSSADDEDCEDGIVGHVSYTVASSVLDDSRMDGHHPILLGIKSGQPIDLPVAFSAIQNDDNTVTMIGEVVRPRAPSLTQPPPLIAPQIISPATAYHPDTPTVEVPITTMVTTIPPVVATGGPMTGPISGPIATGPPGAPMIVDSTTGLLTPIIGPIIVPTYPQDVVSNSIDKIVDVMERLNEAQENGNVSDAENEHLRMELRIAENEMANLDPYTKNNCLLRELQQVDMELQQLRIEPTRTQ